METNVTAQTITRALRRCFGHFPHVKSLFQRLESLYAYECAEEEAEHILLLGDSGVGKSTLLKRFRAMHPPVEHDTYTEIPVLYAEVPPGCSIKKLAGSMLLAMGSPYWNKGNEIDLTYQLKSLLRGCSVRLVILDEVNHLVDRGGVKTHHNIGDWIKRLSDDVRVPFVLAGIPRAEQLLATNDQLRSRFGEVVRIQPFSIEHPEAEKQFRGVLKSFGAQMTGLPSIDLSHPQMAQPFAFATAGRLRAIRKLLVRAVHLAFEQPVPRLTMAVLAQAFSETIYPGGPDERNPFSKKFERRPLTDAGEPFAPREG